MLQKQVMYTYVHRNNEAPSCINRCIGKAVSSSYSERVFINLGIHHATRMRHNDACCLSGRTTFSHISHKRRDLKKKLEDIKCVFKFSPQLFPKHFSL